MKKTLLATALALTCSAAMAAPVPFTNDGAANFTMYDPTGAVNGPLLGTKFTNHTRPR